MNQPQQKDRIIKNIFKDHFFQQEIIIDAKTQDGVLIRPSKDLLSLPTTEFKKINPTKYRVRIHRAQADFPLIFSENFHHGWKLYLIPINSPAGKHLGISPNRYKVYEGSEKTQASFDELKEWADQGLATGLSKERGDNFSWFPLYNLDEVFNASANDSIRFVSKKFQEVIQNDNLPVGPPWETWESKNLVSHCSGTKTDQNGCPEMDLELWHTLDRPMGHAILWPELLHWEFNGFANSWWMDLSLLKKLPQSSTGEPGYYKRNEDGSINFELIIEYWPQRLYYYGLSITIVTLVVCVLLFILRGFTRKKPLTA
ncbi:hypothetical protein UR09_05005 [Candidatus Nitromaritima sp. SCGC AAA799-A02]|nr:hypothetical protein UR09_05005 [Candidatus Nitromaritima sp. SCGC AAA799-A02]